MHKLIFSSDGQRGFSHNHLMLLSARRGTIGGFPRPVYGNLDRGAEHLEREAEYLERKAEDLAAATRTWSIQWILVVNSVSCITAQEIHTRAFRSETLPFLRYSHGFRYQSWVLAHVSLWDCASLLSSECGSSESAKRIQEKRETGYWSFGNRTIRRAVARWLEYESMHWIGTPTSERLFSPRDLANGMRNKNRPDA